MTIESKIAAMVQLWRDAGQHEHAEHLRREMWKLLGKYLAPSRGH